MDRTIVERALRALAALNTVRDIESRSAPASVVAPLRKVEESSGEEMAACQSPCCAGCYEVAPGVRIHPPKCGGDYRVWLERWEARGRLQ
jgi:hypothetical protein